MIEGEVENGRQHVATIGRYSGVVGVRDRGDSREVAYVGDPPSRLPVEGVIDNVAVRAVERITRGVARGFVVLRVVDV